MVLLSISSWRRGREASRIRAMAENEQQGAFDVLLGESRDLVSGRLSAAVSGMLEKAPDALDALIMGTQAAEPRKSPCSRARSERGR